MTLPKGWAKVTFAEIARQKSGNGKLIKGKLESEPNSNSFPAYSASGQDVWRNDFEYEGDAIVVSAVGARCGKAFRASGRWSAIANTHIVFPEHDAVDTDFLFRILNDENFWVKGGTAQPFVKVGATFEKQVNLPPRTEQRRIVAKLDALTVRLARARAELDKVPVLAANLRQQTLAMAFSGELTEGWRMANFDELPPAHEILARIESDKVKLSRTAVQEYETKKSANISATKPRQLIQPDSLTADQESCLWEIPEKWQWAQIGTISFVTKLAGFEYTDYVKYDPEGDLKVLKAENAGPNGFRATGHSMIHSKSVSHLERSFLSGGELLVVFVGAGVGQVALVPGNDDYFLGPNIGMVRPYSKEISSRYLELFLRSAAGKRLLLLSSKAVAQPSISMGAIRATPIAMPPLKEQAEIVRRIQAAFTRADCVEAEAARARALLNRLEAAILASAFRGELVPQDPDDEPASVLLARISAERATTPQAKRGRRTKAIDQHTLSDPNAEFAAALRAG